MKKVILSLVMVAALTVVSCKNGEETTEAPATEEVPVEEATPVVEEVVDSLAAPATDATAPAADATAPAAPAAAPAK
jgi:hypothetical protein